jgi:hypothetical protein
LAFASGNLLRLAIVLTPPADDPTFRDNVRAKAWFPTAHRPPSAGKIWATTRRKQGPYLQPPIAPSDPP